MSAADFAAHTTDWVEPLRRITRLYPARAAAERQGIAG